MRRLLLPLVLLPLLAAGGVAQAADAPARQAAKPASAPAEPLAPKDLEYFVGSWHAVAVDPKTGEKLNVAYRVQPTPGGAWIAGAGQSADLTVRSRDMWGRDPMTGGLVRVVFDASGAYGTFRSQGWTGDTLIFEGDILSGGRTVPLRQTITRVGPREFRAVWEAQRDGVWSAYTVERLTRLAT